MTSSDDSDAPKSGKQTSKKHEPNSSINSYLTLLNSNNKFSEMLKNKIKQTEISPVVNKYKFEPVASSTQIGTPDELKNNSSIKRKAAGGLSFTSKSLHLDRSQARNSQNSSSEDERNKIIKKELISNSSSDSDELKNIQVKHSKKNKSIKLTNNVKHKLQSSIKKENSSSESDSDELPSHNLSHMKFSKLIKGGKSEKISSKTKTKEKLVQSSSDNESDSGDNVQMMMKTNKNTTSKSVTSSDDSSNESSQEKHMKKNKIVLSHKIGSGSSSKYSTLESSKMKQKKSKKKIQTKPKSSESSSSSDSEDEPSVSAQTKKKKLFHTFTKTVNKHSSEESSDSDSDAKVKKSKLSNRPVKTKQKPNSSGSSSDSESSDSGAQVKKSLQVQNQNVTKSASSSDSSEDENVKRSTIKANKKIASSQANKEVLQRHQKHIAPVEQTQSNKSKNKRTSSESNTSNDSSDENSLPSLQAKERVQASQLSSGYKTGEKEKTKQKVQKKVVPKSSSSGESASESEGEKPTRKVAGGVIQHLPKQVQPKADKIGKRVRESTSDSSEDDSKRANGKSATPKSPSGRLRKLENENSLKIIANENNGLEIKSKENVFIIQVPIKLDPNRLLGANISLNNLSRINKKYDSIPSYESQEPLAVFTNNENPQIIKPVGTIKLQRHLKVQPISIVPDALNQPAAFPDNLKSRHPLFGPNFSNKINLEVHIQMKLKSAMEVPTKTKKKKEKKHKTENPPHQEEEIFKFLSQTNSDVGSVVSSKKLKKEEYSESDQKHQKKKKRKDWGDCDEQPEYVDDGTSKKRKHAKLEDSSTNEGEFGDFLIQQMLTSKLATLDMKKKKKNKTENS